jgi:hypothetical protein
MRRSGYEFGYHVMAGSSGEQRCPGAVRFIADPSVLEAAIAVV